jgi:hypothetical protein
MNEEMLKLVGGHMSKKVGFQRKTREGNLELVESRHSSVPFKTITLHHCIFKPITKSSFKAGSWTSASNSNHRLQLTPRAIQEIIALNKNDPRKFGV